MSEFMTLDTIYLAYIAQSAPDLHHPGKSGDFPLFISASREKILCKVNLPNSGHMGTRIIAGAALLLTDED